MGAWGAGILQDDAALDFLGDLTAAPSPGDRMRCAFEDAAGAEYLQYDEGQAALVSAAVVDAVLYGTALGDDGDLQTLLTALDPEQMRALRSMAAEACRRLLAPASELQELWSENEEEYPGWKGRIEGIIARLGS